MLPVAHFTLAEVPGLVLIFGSGIALGLTFARRTALGRRAYLISPLLVLSAAIGVFVLP